MRTFFSSPFLTENIERFSSDPLKRGAILKHFQNAEYALAYNLEKILPKGGVVWALFPKTILGQLLPWVAARKQCKIISVHGIKEATMALLKARALDSDTPTPDLFLTEPDGFTPGGAFFQPNEAKMLEGLELVGIGSAFQQITAFPATHDYVPLSKIITELGIHSPEDFEKEANVFSLPRP